MFGRKKKKKALFGSRIQPSCSYCRRNNGVGQSLCALGLKLQDGKCKKFQYDPLMREPRPAPALRADQYSEEDFRL